MRRAIYVALTLACLALAASSLTAAGGSQAMSPVGTWVQYLYGAGSPGDPGTAIAAYYHGGSMTGGAWSDPWTNASGSWEKVPGNRYRSTFYVMVPDAGGILRIKEEFWMLSKDEMEGQYEIWWVPGPDPLADEVVRLWWGSILYKRIGVEPIEAP